MLGAALVLSAFAAGWAIGARQTPKRPASPPPETELERLAAEQRAFRELMCYSPEIAYGEAMPSEEV